MAKASKTASKTAAAKPAAAKPTAATKATVVNEKGEHVAFDAKANAARKSAERAAEKRGDKLETERYTVNEGRSVRQGGQRFMGNEAIDLTASDAERLLAKGVVTKGTPKSPKKGGSEPESTAIARSTGAGSETDTPDPDSDEAKAQREADEAAAAQNDAAQQAAGLPSGAENR